MKLETLARESDEVGEETTATMDRQASAVAVHVEDALSLAGCAVARSRFPDLGFADPSAEQLLADLELDPRRFDQRRLRSSAVRTMVVDALVREFFERHPGGLAIGLLPGLCTRFSRVDNGSLRWVELESAEVAAFKRGHLRMPDRHVVAQCCSIACAGWMKLLADAGDMPTLIVAQGGFRRAPIPLRDTFFMNAALHLPAGVELVIEHDAHAPLRPSPLRSGGASLSTRDASGACAIYPRVRFVWPHESPEGRGQHERASLDGVSRPSRDGGALSVAHLRFT